MSFKESAEYVKRLSPQNVSENLPRQGKDVRAEMLLPLLCGHRGQHRRTSHWRNWLWSVREAQVARAPVGRLTRDSEGVDRASVYRQSLVRPRRLRGEQRPLPLLVPGRRQEGSLVVCELIVFRTEVV